MSRGDLGGLFVVAADHLKTKAKSAVSGHSFRRKYRHDPAGFVRDCFRWAEGKGPTDYQLEILGLLPRHNRVAVKGPHGLGKTAVGAWLVLWFSLTRELEDWKVITTASAWRQLSKFLWPEIAKWIRLIRWDVIGRDPFDPRTEQFSLNLKVGAGEAFAVASDNEATIEGAHADSLLYLFDEAKTIPPTTFDAAEGAFAGAGDDTDAEAFALAISTPGEPSGRFFEIHSRAPGLDDWHVCSVSLEQCIDAGRVSRAWAEKRAQQWGEQSAVYLNRVRGEFAASDEDSTIPLAWIELANERWHEWVASGRPGDFTSVGVDPARGGADDTVLALRFEKAISELRRFSTGDTMETCGRVRGILEKHGGTAVVDVIGIGAGVVDRLREDEYDVEAFNAAESTDRKDKSGELNFRNSRSAAWWHLRELLDPANVEDIALPPDDLLTGDLTAPKWKVNSSGKIEIESKDEIRKRLKRSTDAGDAVIQAFWAGSSTVKKPWWQEVTDGDWRKKEEHK